MTTEIIILAQGTQERLGMQHGYKQLLPLPACGDTPILVRTMRQINRILPADAQPHGDRIVTVVTWNEIAKALAPRVIAMLQMEEKGTGVCIPSYVSYVELSDPGNSSLKGIGRYLAEHVREWRREAQIRRTVVLLGDVVYSWECLRKLILLSETSGFVGTSDLSGNGGELWGVAWHRDREPAMLSHLHCAHDCHPPFPEYQPGQLRRWISGLQRGDLREHVAALRARGAYLDVDDYTRDIDVPSHVAFLPALSIAARDDDAKNGLTWGTSP